MTSTPDSESGPLTLDTVTAWARSNREWEKVHQYLFHHPQDLFLVCSNRRWPIGHQIVYHGKTDLLKQVLALYSDEQIDINTKSVDDRTLLSVATEKLAAHPAMYAYVSRLFAQDELMRAAKESNWQLVRELLEKSKDLANEKPPYSPNFLLHYIVQNGNVQILQKFITDFQFAPNVVNSDNERPIDLATRLGKQEMCSILRPTTARAQSEPETSATQPVPRANQTLTYHGQSQFSAKPTDLTEPVSARAKPPPIGFSGLVQGIGRKGDETVGQPMLVNTAYLPARPTQPPPDHTPQKEQSPSSTNSSTIRHVRVRKTIVCEVPLLDSDRSNLSPPPSSQSPATMPKSPSATTITGVLVERLTCQLTKKFFIDPVIATDGQTYERAAITEWVNRHHTSPLSGAPMDATFRDNKDIRDIVELMHKQK